MSASNYEKKGVHSFWACECYEEQFTSYFDSFVSRRVPFALSPCHNKDVNESGTLKKMHWHILIYVKNGCSEGTILKLLGGLAANNFVEVVGSPVGYYEYLFHKNEKDKFHYNEEDITLYNGFSMSLIYDNKTLTKNYYNNILSSISEMILNGSLSSFADVVIFCNTNYGSDVLSFLAGKTHYLNTLLKSSVLYIKEKKSESYYSDLISDYEDKLQSAFEEGYDLAKEYYLDYVNFAYEEGRKDQLSDDLKKEQLFIDFENFKDLLYF